jgi:moderate conductance mechanosensitive channel
MNKLGEVTTMLENSAKGEILSSQARVYIYNPIKLAVTIIIILILMYVSIKICNNLIYRSVSRQKKLKFSLDERKAMTVGSLLKSILKYSVYFIGIIGIINIVFDMLFGRELGLAFGSIVGVAVGFGAQNIIKDVINGIFILFEDQFAVGDYVDIEGKSGIVESVEIRITKVRDFNGDLHIIPNGLISKVTNHSRGNIRVLVDVEIAYEEDIDRVSQIISNICEEFSKDNEDIVEGPEVLGVIDIAGGGVKIRVYSRVKPMTQSGIEMKLRKDIKDGLQKANIRVPYQRIRVIKEN